MAGMTDTGGAAFPGPSFTQGGHPNGHSMGMTLRDWFAGQAEKLDRDAPNAAIETLTGRAIAVAKGSLDHWQLWADADAAWRYIQADAMLAARTSGTGVGE